MALSPCDPNSFSRPGKANFILRRTKICCDSKILLIFADLAIVNHIHLDLTVDFERKILYGSVILDVEKINETDFLVTLCQQYFNFCSTQFSKY